MSNHISREQRLDYIRTHSNTSLSYSILFDSGVSGPHVVIVGSTHGSEPVGTEAIMILHRYLTARPQSLLKGRITCILGNPAAYQEGVRFVDENLNRAFLQHPSDTIEGKRAGEIRSYLDGNKHIDALLDLHSVSVGEFQMVAYVRGEQSETFARTISSLPLHFIFTEKDLSGSLIGDAAARGTKAIVIECGNHSSKHAISVAMHHIHATMKYLGMMREHEFPSYTPLAHSSSAKTIYHTIAPIKPHADFHFINGDVSTGTCVHAGEVFAEDGEMKHSAPQDCYIVMPDKHPKPGDSDAGFLCEKTEIDRQIR